MKDQVGYTCDLFRSVGKRGWGGGGGGGDGEKGDVEGRERHLADSPSVVLPTSSQVLCLLSFSLNIIFELVHKLITVCKHLNNSVVSPFHVWSENEQAFTPVT